MKHFLINLALALVFAGLVALICILLGLWRQPALSAPLSCPPHQAMVNGECVPVTP